MKLSEWRDRQRETAELPSGLTVTFRTNIKLADFASQGRIPAPLVGLVDEMIGGATVKVSSVHDFERYGKVIDLVAKLAVIDPPIADVGDDLHLGLDEFSMDDKTFIFNRIHREAGELAPFRSEQESAVGAALALSGVPPET